MNNPNLLKDFIEEFFDYDEFRKCGLFDESIKKDDYESQSKIICRYFGMDSIYEYRKDPIVVHISYVEGHRPKNEQFAVLIPGIYN